MIQRTGRVLSLQWSDRKPFTRRVRWYCAELTPEGRGQDIRLLFDDAEGTANRLYGNDKAAAEADYKAFKTGKATSAMMRKPRPPARPVSTVQADGVNIAICCDPACGKPVRIEGAMSRNGQYWHQRCNGPA